MPFDPTPTGSACPDSAPPGEERHRLAELLLDDADRFVPGAFADGIRHAAARLLEPRFAATPAQGGEAPANIRTPLS